MSWEHHMDRELQRNRIMNKLDIKPNEKVALFYYLSLYQVPTDPSTRKSLHKTESIL